jgi:hypothetical protein
MIDPELSTLSENELGETAVRSVTRLRNGRLIKENPVSRSTIARLGEHTRYWTDLKLVRQINEEARRGVVNDPKVLLKAQSKLLQRLETRLGKLSDDIPQIKPTNIGVIIQEKGTLVYTKPYYGDKYYAGQSINTIPKESTGLTTKMEDNGYIHVQFPSGEVYKFLNEELGIVNSKRIIAERKAHNDELLNGGVLSQEEFKAKMVPIGLKALTAKRREAEKNGRKMSREKPAWIASHLNEDLGYKFGDILSSVSNKRGLDRALKRITNEMNTKVHEKFDTLMGNYVENASSDIQFDPESISDLEGIARTARFSEFSSGNRVEFSKFASYLSTEIDGIEESEAMDIARNLSAHLGTISSIFNRDYSISPKKLEKILSNPEGISTNDLLGFSITKAEQGFQNHVDRKVNSLIQSVKDITCFNESDDSDAIVKYIEYSEKGIFQSEAIHAEDNARNVFFTRELQKEGILNEDSIINIDRVKELRNQRLRYFNQSVKTFAKEKGLDLLGPRHKTYTYVPDPTGQFKEGNLDPYRIGEKFLKDLIKTAKRRASTTREKDLVAAAKELIKKRKLLSHGDFKTTMSKPSKIAYNTVRERLGEANLGEESSRQFRKFSAGGIIPDTGCQFNIDLIKQSGLYLLQRDLVVEEMITALSQGTKKGTGGIGDDFRIFWERYHPEELDLYAATGLGSLKEIQVRPKYTFKLSRCKKTLGSAITNAQACLTSGDINVFSSDPATLNLIAYGDSYTTQNKPIGYTRLFISKENRGEPSLAIDTMEVGNKEFSNHWDWVRTMSLAIMQLGIDLGVKYIFGSDSRVKYGPRQAFGNLYRDPARLYKLGETTHQGWGGRGTYCYGFNNTHKWEGKTSVLFKNWADPSTKSKKKKAKKLKDKLIEVVA